MRILSLGAFTRAHSALEDQLRRYALTTRGKKALTGNVLENLMRRSALSLKATNPRARIAVMKATKAVLGPVLDKQDIVFFVTFTPREFAMPLTQARAFDFQKLRRWSCEQLHGCNHFGVIEGAYYSNYPRHPFKHGQEPWVSFHTHHLCWNVDEAKMKETVDRVNATRSAFLTGLDPAHCHAWRKAGARARIFYMLKGPLEEYLIVNVRQTDQLPNQKKRPFRPGAAVRMFHAIGNRTMHDVVFGSGEGLEIAERVLSRARRAISRADRKLEKRLSTLTTLPVRPHLVDT